MVILWCAHVCVVYTHTTNQTNQPSQQKRTEALLEVREEGEGLVAQPVPQPCFLALEAADAVHVRELLGEERAGVALAGDQGPLLGEEPVCLF